MEESQFWNSEYLNVSGQFQKYLDLYVKTFVIYLGAIGLFLKFAFDANSNSDLRLLMSVFSIFVCLLFFAIIILAEVMIRKLRRKRKTTLTKLGFETDDEFIAGHWASIVFFVFNLFTFIGWIYIIMIGIH